MNERRLVCIVEGHGDVEAVPLLCEQVRASLNVSGWFVDRQAIRSPRSSLVDVRGPSPRRGANVQGIERFVGLAMRRPASAVLLVCDQDDDCPAVWGPSARAAVVRVVAGDAVMAIREFETWLVLGQPESRLAAAHITNPELIRDGKRLMKRLIANYKPSTHQLAATKKLDLESLRARSDSFDKLFRSLAGLFRVSAPRR